MQEVNCTKYPLCHPAAIPNLWATLFFLNIFMVYLTLFYVQWHECVRSSWNWIYSHLCAAAMWVLGMELTSSGRATKLFNGVLQIENKKTRQKQTDSLIFKSEFQDSRGKAITWNWLNSYQQFLNSNKNVYRKVKKKNQIMLNEVPESKACSTTCQPWLYFESHIWFLSPRTLSLIHVKGRLKETIKKKRKHEEWDKIEI